MKNDNESSNAPIMHFMDEKLFKSRSISIFGQISEKIARSVTEQLLALSTESDDPITIYISSPGGHVESGDVVYDMIKFIKPKVRVVGTGWVASAATNIYLAAKKENRFSLPNTRYLVHQPSGGFQGQATDIEIHAKEILSLRARLNDIYVQHTGQDLKVIEDAMERDKFLDPEEAKEFGIIDEVVNQRPVSAVAEDESEKSLD